MLKAPAAIRIVAVACVLLWAGLAHSQSTKRWLKPHPQANLPRLDLPNFELSRPHEVVRATYKFAAEHPEVLSYMPCFCGCDMHSGHRSSQDCFVKTRDKNGDVTQWDEHGIACAMCLAVAERAKQMCDQGASLTDIRADIEKRYGQITGNRTPTPAPPKTTAKPPTPAPPKK